MIITVDIGRREGVVFGVPEIFLFPPMGEILYKISF